MVLFARKIRLIPCLLCFSCFLCFFNYRKGKNTVQVRKKLGKVCGKSVLTVLKLLDIKDAPRSERPVEIDEDEIIIQSNNYYRD